MGGILGTFFVSFVPFVVFYGTLCRERIMTEDRRALLEMSASDLLS